MTIEVVQRRHRHRYEFNNAREQFEEAGFVFSGVSPDNRLVEIVEIPETNSLLLCQYHPGCQAVQIQRTLHSLYHSGS